MADSAHNVDLMTLLVDGISHRLAINGQSLVVFTAIGLVPALQGLVKFLGINTDKHIADDTITGDNVATIFATAIKTLPCFWAEALGPIRDSLVSPHST